MNTDGMQKGSVSHSPAAPPRLTRAEAKAETRRRLVDAAEAVFRRQGYHGASLDQVAAEAGFTKGAVYSTFDSKADLFLALLGRRAAGRQTEIEATLAETGSAEDLVAAIADAVARFAGSIAAERDFWAALIEFMTVVGRDEALQARFAVHHDASREAVATSLREWARRDGSELTIDPRRLATAIMALYNGLTLEGLLAPNEVDAQLYVDAQSALRRGALAAGREEQG